MKKVFALMTIFVFVAGFIASATAEEAKKDGKTLFTDAKCMNCHAVASQGIEAKKPNPKIPDVGTGITSTAEVLAKYLVKEEKIHDKNHPVKFNGTPEELKTLVDWILEINKPAK
jgi:hypothetical protein